MNPWTRLVLLTSVGVVACGPIDVTLKPPLQGQGFQLVTGSFEVPKGAETQRCYFFEIPSDTPIYVNKFEVAQNVGTHHMNIFRMKTRKGLWGAPGDVVAEGQCWTSANWSDWPLIVNSQEAQTGTPNPDDPAKNGIYEWKMPDGVAHRFEPRELIMLQTHYVNATTQATPLQGKVFVNFHSVPESSVTSELGTLFATNQSIRICPGDTKKYFETACRISQSAPVTVVAANSHFHSRGKYFSMSVYDPTNGTSSAPFYETDSWSDPPMLTNLGVQVPPGGSISYHCEYTVPANTCGDPADGCCFTFGGKVEYQEHCNIFVYYYPKQRDVGCF
jgi:hypothetical protein